jgi:hypothetical protein
VTPVQKQQLKGLLEQMVAESEGPSPDEPQGRPAGFIPEVCLKAFYKATRTPFVELVIYRKVDDAYEYLYQDRHDQWWKGFCAYGGMVRAISPARPVELAQKLIDREFKGLGIEVQTLQFVSGLNWPEHPWANPYAVVCLIQVDRDIPEGGGRRWLRADNLPENMVMNHGEYVAQCESFLRYGPLLFTQDNPSGIHRP